MTAVLARTAAGAVWHTHFSNRSGAFIAALGKAVGTDQVEMTGAHA